MSLHEVNSFMSLINSMLSRAYNSAINESSRGGNNTIWRDPQVTFKDIKTTIDAFITDTLLYVQKSKDQDEKVSVATQEKIDAFHKYSQSIKNLTKCEDLLKYLIKNLGWNSTIDDYAQSRFENFIVNKAIDSNLDIPRKSQFVVELAKRLNLFHSKRPSKADIATFAKRDGINVNSPEYKEFVNVVIDNIELANQIATLPVDHLGIYVACGALMTIMACAVFDDTAAGHKIATDIGELLDSAIAFEDMEHRMVSPKLRDQLKKCLSRAASYQAQFVSKNKIKFEKDGTVYDLILKLDNLDRLLTIFKFA